MMKPNDKAIEAAIRYLEAPMSAREQMEKILTAAYAAQFQSDDYAGLVEELRDASHCHQCVASGEKAADAIEALLAERDDFAEQIALRSENGISKDLQEFLRKFKEDDSAAIRMFAQYRDLEIEMDSWKSLWEKTNAHMRQVEAERDALKAELANAQKLGKMQAERIGDYIKKIEDRDALLTLLAPVDDDSRHLTTDEQKIFHSALRRYAKIKKPVNDEVLLAERDALKGLIKIYEKKLNGIEDEIRLAVQSAIADVRPHIKAAERERCATAVETVGEKINVAHHERPEWEDGYLQGVHDAATAIRSGI